MGALREVFAHFTIKADDAQLKKLDKGVSGMAGRLKTFGAALAGGALLIGLRRVVTDASNVEESMNVLRETFKGNTQSVTEWADKTAGVVGRSAATLRAGAGSFGAFLSPLLGDKEKIAEMSTVLSQLSVDLGSFYNITDEEAQLKVFSGLAGETEAVRRLGIDLTEEGLARFARDQHMSKSVKNMTQAEKTELRYQKIMSDTIEKQGDAARTLGDYANSSKAMSEAMLDLRIAVGGFLLGGATKLVQWAAAAAKALEAVALKTNMLKVIGTALASAATAWAAKLAVANAGAILLAGGIVLAILVIEDLYTLLTGGKSVIGDFIDSQKPLGYDAKMWVTGLTGAYQRLIDVLRTLGALEVDIFTLGAAGAMRKVRDSIKAREDAERDARLNAPQRRREAQEKAVLAGDAQGFQEAGGSFEAFRERRLKAVQSGAVKATDDDVGEFGIEKAVKMIQMAPISIEGTGAGKDGKRSIQMAPINITVNATGTSREQALEIAKIAKAEVDKSNRAAFAALREQI